MRGAVVRFVRSYFAVPVVVLLLCTAMLPCPGCATESRPELRYGNIVAGIDFIDSGMSQDLFHSQTLAESDEEALAISFQPGPGTGSFSPTIAQTSTGTITAASTGFFNSNFQFCPVVNIGALPVGYGFGTPYPVTAAKFASHSLMYPEMVVQGNLLGEGNLSKMVGTGVTLPPVQSGSTYNLVSGLSYLEREKGAEGFGAMEKGLPVVLSGHTVDFVSTPSQINNTSIVDRLWRNSHQANALNYLYEGDAAYPRWIAPVKNPYELIDCGVGTEAVKNALILTRPGTFLTRAYWSI